MFDHDDNGKHDLIGTAHMSMEVIIKNLFCPLNTYYTVVISYVKSRVVFWFARLDIANG